jgi:low affinity Fe/Cu permease
MNIADILLELYEQHSENIINHLQSTGPAFSFLPPLTLFLLLGISAPTIVDIDWRLDYSIRSKQSGRNNIPMYFVNLKVKEHGLVRNIEMIASLEEMQDLLASVCSHLP